MSDATEKGKGGSAAARPGGPYWEDAVYRYLSRQHRLAVTAGDTAEAARFDGLMRDVANRSMPDALYWQIDAEAKADRKRRRQQRKTRRRPPPTPASVVERAPSVNVAELKKRIFNPRVSRENVIKALQALPAAERRATIAGLPPGLRRKVGDYLKE